MDIALNIKWSIDNDEIMNAVHAMDSDKFIRMFGIQKDDAQAGKIILSRIKERPALVYEILRLPDRVEIPPAISETAINEGNLEAINNWLEKKYGFPIANYSLNEDLQKCIERYSAAKQLTAAIKDDGGFGYE